LLLFYQLNPTRGFQQLLQKEVDLSSYADLLNQACQRLDSLEERCCYLEKSFAGAAEKRSFRETSLTGRDEPGGDGSRRLCCGKRGGSSMKLSGGPV